MQKNDLLRESGRYCREDAKQGVITSTCSRVSGDAKKGKYRTGDCDERTIGKAGSWCQNEGTCQVNVINSRFDGGFCGYEFECQCKPGNSSKTSGIFLIMYFRILGTRVRE